MKKVASLLLLASAFSCSKKDLVEDAAASAMYQLRVAAVENGGTQYYTPITRVKSGKVAVEFETGEVADIKEYRVEVSADGINFNRVKTIAADLQTPNKMYRDTVVIE